MIRAQFQCKEVTDTEYGQNIKMEVDYNGCKEFTPYTPFGKMEFGIEKSASAIGKFKVGTVYNVDFTPVEQNINEI